MKGILCPVCGSPQHDVENTRRWMGVIMRMRKCYNDHVFYTEERVSTKEAFRDADRIGQRIRRRAKLGVVQ